MCQWIDNFQFVIENIHQELEIQFFNDQPYVMKRQRIFKDKKGTLVKPEMSAISFAKQGIEIHYLPNDSFTLSTTDLI